MWLFQWFSLQLRVGRAFLCFEKDSLSNELADSALRFNSVVTLKRKFKLWETSCKSSRACVAPENIIRRAKSFVL